ncbi:hypothetical protein GYMC10_1043 [Paenibacillus sp. Y412MC10]|nr:hypothetical protein GYMC10_1043 [Paenibacillus sp. Y412MC10]
MSLSANDQLEVVNELKSKYSKEEFDFIVSLFPTSKLSEEIRSNEKKFRKYLKGFRPDKLPLKRFQEIYYKSIFIENNLALALHLNSLLKNYMLKMDRIISRRIEPAKSLREKIQNNDIDGFINLVDILVNNNYEKVEHIIVYFKFFNITLTREQLQYVDNELQFLVQRKELRIEIENESVERYEQEIKELKSSFKGELKEKEMKIKELVEQIEHNKKEYDEILYVNSVQVDAMEFKYKRHMEDMIKEKKNLTNFISELESKITQMEVQNKSDKRKVSELTLLVNQKEEEFLPLIESKWNASNAALFEKKVAIQHSIDSLIRDREILRLEIEKFILQKNDLEKIIESLQMKGGTLFSDFKDLLYKIGVQSVEAVPSNQSVYYLFGNQMDADEETVERLDFIEDLSDNLSISGVQNLYAKDFSRYLYAIVVCGMSPLFIGFNGRKIANALSQLLAGATPDIISLPPGYVDSNELIHLVKSSSNRVILIENVIDNVSELVYLPLLKQNNDRLILFSMESSEPITLLPSSILNYLVPIDVDSIIQYVKKPGELIRTNVVEAVFKKSFEESSVEANLKTLKKFNSVYSLPLSTRIKWAEIMSVIDSLESPQALYNMLVFSLSMLCSRTGRTTELNQYVEQQGFSAETYKILCSHIEENYSE